MENDNNKIKKKKPAMKKRKREDSSLDASQTRPAKKQKTASTAPLPQSAGASDLGEPMPQLQEKLRKFNIKKRQYVRWKEGLTRLGYSAAQIDAIVLRKCPKNSVNTLISLHRELVKLPLYGLTVTLGAPSPKKMEKRRYYVWLEQDALVYARKIPQGIHQVRISRAELGEELFNQLIQVWPGSQPSALTEPLCQAVFTLIAAKENQGKDQDTLSRITHEQLARTARKGGGGNTLTGLQAHYGDLLALGLNGSQIISIANNKGGSKNLQAVKEHCPDLQQMGFTLADITKIAGQDGGSLNIEAIIKHQKLLQTFQLTPAQITSMCSYKEKFRKFIDSIKSCLEQSNTALTAGDYDNGESLSAQLATGMPFTAGEQSFENYLAKTIEDEPSQTQSIGLPINRTSDLIIKLNRCMYSSIPSSSAEMPAEQPDGNISMPEPHDTDQYFNQQFLQ